MRTLVPFGINGAASFLFLVTRDEICGFTSGSEKTVLFAIECVKGAVKIEERSRTRRSHAGP
jgi:hypothetical protein